MPSPSEQPILIVDDESLNLAVMRTILKDEARLIFASNALDALAATKTHAPKMILLDVEMPGMDGYEVCCRLKADAVTEHIPIIFITSRADVKSESKGFEAGAVDYITKPIYPAVVLARVRAHLSRVAVEKLELAYHDSIMMLGKAGHYSDTDTGVHIWRMGSYSGVIAKALGWNPAAARTIEFASPMHDTGKIGIPHTILRKLGPLNAEEWIVMKTHSQIGYDILRQSKSPVFSLAAEIALNHHEKWDGSGYPNGLKGEAIPESARIVALADVFDALTMKRPYKEAWSVERSLETIQASSGKHFDPRLVQAFMSALPALMQAKQGWHERYNL